MCDLTGPEGEDTLDYMPRPDNKNRKKRSPRPPTSEGATPKSQESLLPSPIVGIGASAGGLEALQQLFGNMPSTTGMAFVLVQHLDPHHETLMPELLSKHTRVPVELVRYARGTHRIRQSINEEIIR